MPSKYFTILTNIGSALHANAQIQQTKVPWTHMALGDGGGIDVQPDQKQTGLVREVHRLPITAIDAHPTNPNWIVVEAVVPNNVGGWTVRESAIYGGTGGLQCIVVGNYPASYKPVLAEGAVREMVMRMIVEISSTATVNLAIDPAVAIASRGWVESQIASESKRGMVQLATPTQVQEGVEVSAVITPAGLSARTATETRTGIAEIATQAIAEAGTDDARMMSAKKVLQLIRSVVAQATETLRGTLRIGTQEEVDTGTDDSVVVTPKKLLFGISALWASDGYIVLPKFLFRLSIQWGSVRVNSAATPVQSRIITLPVQNTGGTYYAICEAQDVGANGVGTRTKVQTLSSSNFNFSYAAHMAIENVRVQWWALGRVL